MDRPVEGARRLQGECGVTRALTLFRKDAIIRNNENNRGFLWQSLKSMIF